MMKEAEIRDYISNNLNILSDELILVSTEYKLENIMGTNGYIDILARDVYDNYVIIEIKKSKQSSRSAIHEIMKYVSLLKNTLKLKDSEIRTIVVSTEWEELRVPFYEWKSKVDLEIEGYEFTSERKCVKVCDVIAKGYERELSRNQLAFLYKTVDEYVRCKDKLVNVIQKSELDNFFLLEFKNEGNAKVIFPFALVLVIQRCSEEEYISILTKRKWEEREFHDYGFEGEELLVFLEEGIYEEIIKYKLFNDVEICSPEKLLGMVSQQAWIHIGVIKSGYFINENRADEWFFKQATGVGDNNNNYIFCDSCDNKFKLKFSEMQNNIREFICYKDDMLSCFEELRENIENKGVVRTSLHVYNRGNIILDLIMYESSGEIEELPHADIILEYENGEVERYIILLAYSQNEKRLDCLVLENLLRGNGLDYMQMLWSGEIVRYNAVIMKNLGLTYDWLKYNYKNDCWRLQRNFMKKKFQIFYNNYINDIKKMERWYFEHVIS